MTDRKETHDSNNNNNNNKERKNGQHRRPAVSLRVQELAKKFEQIARVDTQSSLPSKRGSSSRLIPSVTQERRHSTVHPPAAVMHTKRPVDGLPNTGGATLPTFASLRETSKKTILEQPKDYVTTTTVQYGKFPNAKEEEAYEGTTMDEEQSLLGKSANETVDRPSPSTETTLVRPFPAHEVFAPNAYPLHLPHLDVYLAKDSIFNPPEFSDARLICSERETKLYGYELGESFSKAGLEVCGAQLKIPVNVRKTQQETRQRKKAARKSTETDTTHELDLLTKKDFPTSKSFKEDKEEAESPTEDRAWAGKSSMSTAIHPKSRLDKFPPLMLLEETSLDELKSNAIGPRKPLGGFTGYFTHSGPILGIIVDFVIGTEGSTLAAGIFRLQLFMDFVQLTNLNSLFANTAAPSHTSVNKFLLFTLPSIMALDFVSMFGYAVFILMAWIVLVALLLFCFWRMTLKYNPNRNVEGFNSQPWLFRPFFMTERGSYLEQKAPTKSWRSTPWSKFCNIMIVILLSVLYIPLGKLCLDALVWSVDYWPADTAAQFASDPTVWRDPQNICYTTTMRKDEFNWAYIIVSVAAVTMFFYMLWFPYQMRRTILTLLPRVPKYNELGEKRSKDDLNAEYIRLLGKDSSPLSFMYQAYKRDWGNYKPLYLLFFKFSNIFIISVFAHENCLWRNFEANTIVIAQQTILIAIQGILLIVHLCVKPFIDQISNRSELISRVGYVIDDVLGLLVATQVKDAAIFKTWILYTVYAFTYTGNIYFALANTSFFGHWIKYLQRRIDFRIDIFSPYLRLDMHIKRRVWQETLSTLLLTGPDYHMPFDQLVTFSVLPEDCPPYLLSFQGTVAERHIENLKIVKQVGMDRFKSSVDVLRGEVADRWESVTKEIQLHYTGPDAYWKPLDGLSPDGVSSFFGEAFLIPFPPTLAFRYDQTPEDKDTMVKLTKLFEFETFLWQNRSEVIQRRKYIRAVLRSLDGQRVYCPHVQAVHYDSSRSSMVLDFFMGRRASSYSLAKPVFHSDAILTVTRKSSACHNGYNFQSGFEVSVSYKFGQRTDADGTSIIRTKLTIDGATAFGLRDDFEWSPSVQRFFHANRSIIEARLGPAQNLLQEYRLCFYEEAKEKRKKVGYSFLVDIYDQPVLEAAELERRLRESGCKESLLNLPCHYPATVTLLLERLNVLARSPVHRWWFLFWDDLWRQNSGDYKALKRERRLLSPQFPSSIAWTPMPRDRLELLLKSKAGLWSDTKKKKTIFTPGLLNQIYFTLEELAFHRGRGAGPPFPIHLGVADSNGSIQRASASLLSPKEISRLTGGGTDDNQTNIMDRHEWPWTEQRLSGTSRGGIWQKVRFFLTLNRYTPNDQIEGVWIYAKLTDAGTGQWRYEAEMRSYQNTASRDPLPFSVPEHAGQLILSPAK